jgi:RNA polymerase sigma-70 factor (ECF subfamily)
MGDQVNKLGEEREASAFRSLCEIFWPKLCTMLMRQGADRATAERIAEEALLAAWSKAQPSTTAGWREIAARLYGITRNLRIGRLRGHEAWQRFSVKADDTAAAANGETAAAGEQAAKIEAALATLPPEQMQVLRLAFIDGLSSAEIAASLSLPPADVKSRTLLAYETLRGAMERGS